MPRSNVPVTNFTSGKFDTKLFGRSDIEQYKDGAKEADNVVIDWYGGASKTPGTYFVLEVKDSSKITTLIPFIFSNVQAYILEFGDLYIRFFKDNGNIESGGSPYEVVTTYTETEVRNIQWAQTADVIYLFHPSHHPAQLVRSSDTSWALSDIAFEKGPLLDTNTTATTITPSADTGAGITLTASTAIFDSDHVQSIWRVKDGYVNITAFSSSTSVTATVLYSGNLGTGPGATADWAEGAFSTHRGYPACGTFYEDRLVMAATAHQPNTLFLSEPGAYEQFEGGAADDDAIVDTINSQQLNIIKWLHSGTFLAVGNEGGMVKYWSGGDSTPLTPSNKNAKEILSVGCNSVLPMTIHSLPHYVQRDGTTVRVLAYSLSDDRYYSGDVTLLSREIVDAEIIDMAYQQSPHSIAWYVTSSGKLISSTLDLRQKITAFSDQTDPGNYKAVASIPVAGYDQVWFIVERTINGSTVQNIEYLMPYDEDTQTDLFYVRCGLTYDGAATTSITGLTHLEGETVAILADGFIQPSKTVSSGAITLDRAASKVHVGIGYTAIIETLDLDAGGATGSALSKRRHIGKMFIRFYNTIGAQFGAVSGELDEIPFAKPASFFNGLKQVTFPQGWKRERTIRIEQPKPLPMTVSAIYPNMSTND